MLGRAQGVAAQLLLPCRSILGGLWLTAALRPTPRRRRSCLGAESDAASRRLRTKAAGEEVVRSKLGPISTIFKPAALTGTEDKLFNAYAQLAKKTPLFPLIDGGATRMQPVWVRDVAAGARRGGWAACGPVGSRHGNGRCGGGGQAPPSQAHPPPPPTTLAAPSAPAHHPPRSLRPRPPPSPLPPPVPAAIMNSLKTYDSLGQTYHLAGPDVMTVAEQVRCGRGGECRCACSCAPPCPRSPDHASTPPPHHPNRQVDFMFQTIRERNSSVYMPARVALAMAAGWDWLGARTPIRGPAMFSADHIAEMAEGREYTQPPGTLGFEHLDIVPHKVGWRLGTGVGQGKRGGRCGLHHGPAPLPQLSLPLTRSSPHPSLPPTPTGHRGHPH